MNHQVNLVTLGVKDLKASRQFYSHGLGWTPLLDLDEIVFYQIGKGLALALFPLAKRQRSGRRRAASPGSKLVVAPA
ncbi:VOC family protein [Streptomyces exfoliatus]|uniref:VOC family protein n=1 Tax=Streptomyces exfoliatus TaxID=1905 RepID=UPI003C2D0484